MRGLPSILLVAMFFLLPGSGTSAQDVTIGPLATPGADGTTYVDPDHGWAVTYGDDWEVLADGGELVLGNGVSTVSFATLADHAGDPVACLAANAAALAAQPGHRSVQPATDDAGQPVRGEDAERRQAYAVYLVEREGTMFAVYLDCRTVTHGGAVLLITQLTAAAAFNAENEPRQELLAGVDVPTDPCGALVAYVAETRGRLDRYYEDSELPVYIAPGNSALFREKADRVRALLAEQEAMPVPPGAEQAQHLMVALLTTGVELLDQFAASHDALAQGSFNVPLPGDDLIDELYALGGQAAEELDRLDAQCGEAEGRDVAPPAAATDAQGYACPPDQAMLEEWRGNATELRETAERIDDPLDREPFLILSDQWDRMATDWELACLAQASGEPALGRGTQPAGTARSLVVKAG